MTKLGRNIRDLNFRITPVKKAISKKNNAFMKYRFEYYERVIGHIMGCKFIKKLNLNFRNNRDEKHSDDKNCFGTKNLEYID